MKAKIFTYAAILFLCTVVFGGTLWAQSSFWEGKVTAAPYGLLPHSGMYAASNAFPLDTKVTITHPSNGTEIDVRVVARVENERVFMQVSRDVAQKLGITEDEIITVQVTPVESEADVIDSAIAREEPFSKDPDLNPSVAAKGESLSVVEEYLAEKDAGPIMTEEGNGAEKVEEAEKNTTAGPPEKPEQPAQPEQPVQTQALEQEPELTEEDKEEAGPSTDRAPQVANLPVREQPRAEITVSLPEPGLEPSVPTVVTGPESVKQPEKGEAKEGPSAPIQSGPMVTELEPLFMQEKDRRYTPNVPQLPDSTKVAEGPVSELENVTTEQPEYVVDGGLRHAPEPTKTPGPKVDIASAAKKTEAVKEGEVAHDPVLPTEKEKIAKAEDEKAEEEADELKEIPEDAELVLVPAEERPPEGPVTVPEEEKKAPSEKAVEKEVAEGAEKAPVAGPVTAGGAIPVQRTIDSGSYYLQVAAYSKLDLAQDRGRQLASQYPVTLFKDEKPSNAPYKLMIGPLNEHESGTLLFTFTARGYRDAFIRKGN